MASDALDVDLVRDQMTVRGWSLTGLLNPTAIHVSPTLRSVEPGVADRFVEHLRERVTYVRDMPNIEGGENQLLQSLVGFIGRHFHDELSAIHIS